MVTALLVVITLLCFFSSSAISHCSGALYEERGSDVGVILSICFFFVVNCFGGLCAIGIVYVNH